MSQPGSDDALGAALTSLFATADPVPAHLRAAASMALGWRDIDAELAELTGDSLVNAGRATVRGAAPRLLSFATGDITIDLEITEDGDTVRLLGQIAPPQSTDVAIEFAGGRHTGRTDEIGRFQFDDLPSGWLRVVVASGESGTSHTEWMRT